MGGRRKIGRAVVVANGEFPRGRALERALAGADAVVACDGAAARLLARGITPDFAVGDGDSLPAAARKALGRRFRRVGEQQTNDLAKALRRCRELGAAEVTVVGAGGGRDDHLIGNVFRLLDFAADFSRLTMTTASGRFEAFAGAREFRVGRGASLSVFAPPSAAVRSAGLEWPLDGVRFETPAVGTLNRAAAETVSIWSDGPIIVYFAGKKRRPLA